MSEFENFTFTLRSYFCGDWDFKRNGNSITLMRDTGDHKETIRVSKNDLWDVTIKIMNRERQIFTQTSYNTHHTKQIPTRMIPVIDRAFNKISTFFSSQPPRDSGNFQHGTIVEKESCNIGKRHNHFYITQFVSLRIKDTNQIMNFLNLRYEFFSVG